MSWFWKGAAAAPVGDEEETKKEEVEVEKVKEEASSDAESTPTTITTTTTTTTIKSSSLEEETTTASSSSSATTTTNNASIKDSHRTDDELNTELIQQRSILSQEKRKNAIDRQHRKDDMERVYHFKHLKFTKWREAEQLLCQEQVSHQDYLQIIKDTFAGKKPKKAKTSGEIKKGDKEEEDDDDDDDTSRSLQVERLDESQEIVVTNVPRSATTISREGDGGGVEEDAATSPEERAAQDEKYSDKSAALTWFCRDEVRLLKTMHHAQINKTQCELVILSCHEAEMDLRRTVAKLRQEWGEVEAKGLSLLCNTHSHQYELRETYEHCLKLQQAIINTWKEVQPPGSTKDNENTKDTVPVVPPMTTSPNTRPQARPLPPSMSSSSSAAAAVRGRAAVGRSPVRPGRRGMNSSIGGLDQQDDDESNSSSGLHERPKRAPPSAKAPTRSRSARTAGPEDETLNKSLGVLDLAAKSPTPPSSATAARSGSGRHNLHMSTGSGLVMSPPSSSLSSRPRRTTNRPSGPGSLDSRSSHSTTSSNNDKEENAETDKKDTTGGDVKKRTTTGTLSPRRVVAPRARSVEPRLGAQRAATSTTSTTTSRHEAAAERRRLLMKGGNGGTAATTGVKEKA
jgi:hypothetical protein